MTTRDIDKETLERMIETLEINVENIYHLILAGGIEMIGELFPPAKIEVSNDEESDDSDLDLEDDEELVLELEDKIENEITKDDPNDIVFLNPIRVMKDSWIDLEGNFQEKTFFVEWNSCVDGPYTHINKNRITAINTPKSETLVEYLKAIYNQYYPLLEEIKKDENGKINLETISSSLTKKPISTNIISFSPYKKKRESGQF